MNRQQSLQYILNTNGGATVDAFKEDWAPVGGMEWDLLVKEGLAKEESNGCIFLTDAGKARLNELKAGV